MFFYISQIIQEGANNISHFVRTSQLHSSRISTNYSRSCVDSVQTPLVIVIFTKEPIGKYKRGTARDGGSGAKDYQRIVFKYWEFLHTPVGTVKGQVQSNGRWLRRRLFTERQRWRRHPKERRTPTKQSVDNWIYTDTA